MAKFYSLPLCILLTAWKEVSAELFCPEGWTAFDGNCYIYKEEAATFDSAQNLNKYIVATNKNKCVCPRTIENVSDAWIGLNDLSSEGTFAWIFSRCVASYTNWRSCEPSSQADEDCVEMLFDGFWSDNSCGVSRRYFCELELCADGMYFYGDSCYSYSDVINTFAFVQTACTNEGGYLVEVNSAEENDFLVGLMSNFEVSRAWIGLSDQAEEGIYTWVTSGIVADFTNWADGKPDDYTVEDCIEIHANGTWNDRGCLHVRRYFCERNICPDGYSLFGKSCYSMVTTPADFESAQAACGTDGGYLAEINSAEENAFLFDIRGSANCTASDVWVGLTDQETEGTFVLASSGSSPMYTNWFSNEPDNQGDTDCVEMWASGQWNDQQCSKLRMYFCEIEAIYRKGRGPWLVLVQNPGTLEQHTDNDRIETDGFGIEICCQ